MSSFFTAIDESDINSVLKSLRGIEYFGEALNQWQGLSLLYGFAQYLQFNSIFKAGLNNLINEIVNCPSLAQDLSKIKIHRSNSSKILKALAEYYDVQVEDICIARQTLASMNNVKQAYLMNAKVSEKEIFKAIGFNIAAEIIAEHEYSIINKFLRGRWFDLGKFLQGRSVSVSDIESDLLESALASANHALEYYVGDYSKAQAKEWILEGISHFANLHTEFMSSLLNDSRKQHLQFKHYQVAC